MEAPENIYLFENPISKEPDDRWLSKRSCNDDIEYTRTDAFIKKLEEWLDEYISDWVNVETPTLVGSFKNYVEGKLDYGW